MLDAKFENERQRAAQITNSALSQALLDGEVRRELDRIRRSRFYEGANTQEEASTLAKRLIHGDLSAATDMTRASGVACCARWQTTNGDPAQVREVLTEANRLVRTDDAIIAEAFLAAKNDWQQGLAALAPINSDVRRTAALQIIR